MAAKPCVMCGKPAQAKTDFCADCFKRLEDRYLPKEEAPTAPPRDWTWAAWLALAVSVIILAIRIPQVATAFAPPKPFRAGPADTDRSTDQCLRHLWTISRLIQERRWPSTAFACPVSGQGYVSKGSRTDLTVQCPTPASHRMSRLAVSRAQPIPEVVR